MPDQNQSWNWDRYRPWLGILASRALPDRLQARMDPSDVVQQTLAEAWKNQSKFRGESEAEKQAWLRGILGNIVAGQQRFHLGTAARNMDREQQVRDSLDQTSLRLQQFVAKENSPSQAAQDAEQGLIIATALDQLPEDYREVLILRHFEDLSHDEIAKRMDRSAAAVRMLWIRALTEIKKQFSKP